MERKIVDRLELDPFITIKLIDIEEAEQRFLSIDIPLGTIDVMHGTLKFKNKTISYIDDKIIVMVDDVKEER